ncbi:MAG: glucosamine--fructose-6-phosphate aminotransferase (isomerizing) [Cellvibrionaceae bacterium]|jgi:glucosamine--fructose-6-phosphate aminotransferase (isomerizing)
MCGIVGYIGGRQAPTVIYNGLSKLEYRGYDSAGIAVLNGADIHVRRDSGKLARLGKLLEQSPIIGTVGIGHTRWATHGKPNQANAHPHQSMHGSVVVVQNGIVENYAKLKNELESEGVVFQSETDTEVIAHLIEKHLELGQSFLVAVQNTLKQLEGANAVVAMNPDNPETLICARLGNSGGVALGIGENEMFIASDIPAILEYTKRMVFLENGQMAVINRHNYQVMDIYGQQLAVVEHLIDWDSESASMGSYAHYMQKEIFEQGKSLRATMAGRIDAVTGEFRLPEMNLTPELVNNIQKIYTVACGTSYYSGLVGKFLIEGLARIPVEVEYGSEFRYYDPIIDDKTVFMSITQSGETADTLAASEQARENGAKLWSIVNAYGSQSMRTADGYIAMNAGPEIGVASTKAYTCSIVDQFMLACVLGQMKGQLTKEEVAAHSADLEKLPALIDQILERDGEFKALAEKYVDADDFLFIGRGINYPTALEGALKLKEISYIHAEGYPAGEMKHGPIALIDEKMPVLAIVTKDALYEKMFSQVQQAKARDGRVIALATVGDDRIEKEADDVIWVPECSPLLAPIVNVIPLQLLSYHMAVLRGCDVDMPRNLAKSVTVE